MTTSTAKRMNLDESFILDNTHLTQLFEDTAEGTEILMKRRGRKYDPNTEGLMLIRNGFRHIVPLYRGKEKDTYYIYFERGIREEKLLSIILPVFNEENTVGELLDKLVKKQMIMNTEIIIVESNSNDRTREIVQQYLSYEHVRLVLEDKPQGKGNAVLRGIQEAKGQFIAIQDGDLEYDVEDYDKLLVPIVNDETLFVLGSRYRKDDWHMRKFAGKGKMIADYLNLGQTLLTWILNTACGCKLEDPFTMYKIFHRECMYGVNFVGGNFGLDWELVIRFIRKGYVPVEIPISYKARSYEEGKHIALLGTPIEGLKALWRCRFCSKVYDYGDDISI